MTSMTKYGVVALALALSGVTNADLKSIDDDELSGVTGQSGLTVAYSGRATLGQFRFEKLGTYQVDGITMGGAGVTADGSAQGLGAYFDDAIATIDIGPDGTLDVRWEPGAGSAIDWGFRANEVSLISSTAQQVSLLSGVEAWGYLRRAYRRVEPTAGANGLPVGSNMYTAFTVEDLSSTVTPDTLGLTGAYVRGTESGGQAIGGATLTSEFSRWANDGAAGFSSPLSDITDGFAAMEYTYRPVSAADSPTGVETVAVEVHGFAADIGMTSLSVGQVDLGVMRLDNVQVHDTVLTFTP
ncbi:DUF6160 family protein [Marinobacter sp. F4216]|uniref:DUF6160 family protein n=1 Tax=Marinobacter sp. F4216 TaxID=2874281 RepID=UPI001CBA9C33|nr:DUF6160 family protein [Marinobacter sp. F4216]MBZ2167918.1 DUF6160 family protein [Marinobacter sp. F4216]